MAVLSLPFNPTACIKSLKETWQVLGATADGGGLSMLVGNITGMANWKPTWGDMDNRVL